MFHQQICANMAVNADAFVGDYFYQEPRREAVDIAQLAERTAWILRSLEANRPEHARPKYILILRDGLSTGQFQMVGYLHFLCSNLLKFKYELKRFIKIATKIM
jgi:hypothetical protein